MTAQQARVECEECFGLAREFEASARTLDGSSRSLLPVLAEFLHLEHVAREKVETELAEVNAFRAEPFKTFRNILGDHESDDEAVAGSVIACLVTQQETARLLRETKVQLADARRERDELCVLAAPARLAKMSSVVKERDDLHSRLALVEAGAAQLKAQCLQIVKTQPFYPDTHTGTRQLWVKDQIATKIRALSTSAGTELLAAVRLQHAALNRFGHHSAGCATHEAGTWMHADAKECGCGLADALASPCLRDLG